MGLSHNNIRRRELHEMNALPDKDESLRSRCDGVRREGGLVIATWIEKSVFHAVLFWRPEKRQFQVEYFPFFVEHWGYQLSGYTIETYRLGEDCKLPNDVKQKAMEFLVSGHESTPIAFRSRYEELLVVVLDGHVVEYTWEMGLSPAEFVRLRFGKLPTGAWVGTVSRIDGELVLTSSKHIYGYQLPVPEAVNTAVRAFLKW